MGPRAGLDVCEKFRPHRDFFLYICSYLVLHCSGIGLSMVVCIVSYYIAVDFSSRKNPTASVGSEPAILGTRGQHENSIPGPSSP
jgi:hypothetical protein